MTITADDLGIILEEVFDKADQMRIAGHNEYSHKDSNALANFERLSDLIGIERERVLSVYLMKHIDGIMAWVKGHRSQREGVRGRIIDAIVYLIILYAMAGDE